MREEDPARASATCRIAKKRLVDRKNFGRIESVSPSGSNSAVECDLAKVEVAGSNPVSRSKVQAKARLEQ